MGGSVYAYDDSQYLCATMPMPVKSELPRATPEEPVLGLLIDESLPVPSRPRARGPLVTIDVKPAELQTVQRLLRLADTATGAHDKMVLDQFEHLVVRLPARGYGTTEFDMTEARRKALVDAGRDAVRAHFARPRVAPGRPGGAWDREEAERAKRIADRMATKLLSE